MDRLLWTEKYRPKKVEDVILPKVIKKQFDAFVENEDVPNLILHGPPGVGKTSLAKALLDTLECDYIVVNGSNEGRFLDIIRGRITNFAASMALNGKKKFVIIDEADRMPVDTVQDALRHEMEAFASVCGFIFTTNNYFGLTKYLRSRCTDIDFNLTAAQRKECATAMLKRIFDILETEKYSFDKKAIGQCIVNFAPDWRKVIGHIQGARVGSKIDTEVLLGDHKVSVDDLIELMKKKNVQELRRYVAETSFSFDRTVSDLYNNLHKYVDAESDAETIALLAEYEEKATRSVNKEICLMAMLVEISGNVTWKK